MVPMHKHFMQVNRHIGVMVSFKNGAAYIAAILNNHMEGHRPLTQYVQPMDLKGFLIQYFKHLLNVIKQLGPLKHSTEMSQKLGFTVFTPH